MPMPLSELRKQTTGCSPHPQMCCVNAALHRKNKNMRASSNKGAKVHFAVSSLLSLLVLMVAMSLVPRLAMHLSLSSSSIDNNAKEELSRPVVASSSLFASAASFNCPSALSTSYTSLLAHIVFTKGAQLLGKGFRGSETECNAADLDVSFMTGEVVRADPFVAGDAFGLRKSANIVASGVAMHNAKIILEATIVPKNYPGTLRSFLNTTAVGGAYHPDAEQYRYFTSCPIHLVVESSQFTYDYGPSRVGLAVSGALPLGSSLIFRNNTFKARFDSASRETGWLGGSAAFISTFLAVPFGSVTAADVFVPDTLTADQVEALQNLATIPEAFIRIEDNTFDYYLQPAAPYIGGAIALRSMSVCNATFQIRRNVIAITAQNLNASNQLKNAMIGELEDVSPVSIHGIYFENFFLKGGKILIEDNSINVSLHQKTEVLAMRFGAIGFFRLVLDSFGDNTTSFSTGYDYAMSDPAAGEGWRSYEKRELISVVELRRNELVLTAVNQSLSPVTRVWIFGILVNHVLFMHGTRVLIIDTTCTVTLLAVMMFTDVRLLAFRRAVIHRDVLVMARRFSATVHELALTGVKRYDALLVENFKRGSDLDSGVQIVFDYCRVECFAINPIVFARSFIFLTFFELAESTYVIVSNSAFYDNMESCVGCNVKGFYSTYSLIFRTRIQNTTWSTRFLTQGSIEIPAMAVPFVVSPSEPLVEGSTFRAVWRDASSATEGVYWADAVVSSTFVIESRGVELRSNTFDIVNADSMVFLGQELVVLLNTVNITIIGPRKNGVPLDYTQLGIQRCVFFSCQSNTPTAAFRNVEMLAGDGIFQIEGNTVDITIRDVPSRMVLGVALERFTFQSLVNGVRFVIARNRLSLTVDEGAATMGQKRPSASARVGLGSSAGGDTEKATDTRGFDRGLITIRDRLILHGSVIFNLSHNVLAMRLSGVILPPQRVMLQPSSDLARHDIGSNWVNPRAFVPIRINSIECFGSESARTVFRMVNNTIDLHVSNVLPTLLAYAESSLSAASSRAEMFLYDRRGPPPPVVASMRIYGVELPDVPLVYIGSVRLDGPGEGEGGVFGTDWLVEGLKGEVVVDVADEAVLAALSPAATHLDVKEEAYALREQSDAGYYLGEWGDYYGEDGGGSSSSSSGEGETDRQRLLTSRRLALAAAHIALAFSSLLAMGNSVDFGPRSNVVFSDLTMRSTLFSGEDALAIGGPALTTGRTSYSRCLHSMMRAVSARRGASVSGEAAGSGDASAPISGFASAGMAAAALLTFRGSLFSVRDGANFTMTNISILPPRRTADQSTTTVPIYYSSAILFSVSRAAITAGGRVDITSLHVDSIFIGMAVVLFEPFPIPPSYLYHDANSLSAGHRIVLNVAGGGRIRIGGGGRSVVSVGYSSFSIPAPLHPTLLEPCGIVMVVGNRYDGETGSSTAPLLSGDTASRYSPKSEPAPRDMFLVREYGGESGGSEADGCDDELLSGPGADAFYFKVCRWNVFRVIRPDSVAYATVGATFPPLSASDPPVDYSASLNNLLIEAALAQKPAPPTITTSAAFPFAAHRNFAVDAPLSVSALVISESALFFSNGFGIAVTSINVTYDLFVGSESDPSPTLARAFPITLPSNAPIAHIGLVLLNSTVEMAEKSLLWVKGIGMRCPKCSGINSGGPTGALTAFSSIGTSVVAVVGTPIPIASAAALPFPLRYRTLFSSHLNTMSQSSIWIEEVTVTVSSTTTNLTHLRTVVVVDSSTTGVRIPTDGEPPPSLTSAAGVGVGGTEGLRALMRRSTGVSGFPIGGSYHMCNTTVNGQDVLDLPRDIEALAGWGSGGRDLSSNALLPRSPSPFHIQSLCGATHSASPSVFTVVLTQSRTLTRASATASRTKGSLSITQTRFETASPHWEVALPADTKTEETRKNAEVGASVGLLIGGGVMAPTTGAKASVAMAMLRVAKCAQSTGNAAGGDDDEESTDLLGSSGDSVLGEPLSPFVHPLSFAAGSSPHRYYMGAIIGNCLIIPVAAFLVLRYPLVWVLQRWGLPDNPPTDQVLTYTGWPSVVLVPSVTLAEGTTLSAAKLLVNSGTAQLILGFVGAVQILGILIVWFRALYILFQLPLRREKAEFEGWVWWPFVGMYDWTAEGEDEEDEDEEDNEEEMADNSEGDAAASSLVTQPIKKKKDRDEREELVDDITESEAALFLEQWANIVGGKLVLCADGAALCCSVIVGLIEGLGDGLVECHTSVTAMAVCAIVQCLLSLLTPAPLEFLIQLVTAIVVIMIAIAAAVASFKAEDSFVSEENEELLGLTVNCLGFAGMSIGIVCAIVNLMKDRSILSAVAQILSGGGEAIVGNMAQIRRRARRLFASVGDFINVGSTPEEQAAMLKAQRRKDRRTPANRFLGNIYKDVQKQQMLKQRHEAERARRRALEGQQHMQEQEPRFGPSDDGHGIVDFNTDTGADGFAAAQGAKLQSKQKQTAVGSSGGVLGMLGLDVATDDGVGGGGGEWLDPSADTEMSNRIKTTKDQGFTASNSLKKKRRLPRDSGNKRTDGTNNKREEYGRRSTPPPFPLLNRSSEREEKVVVGGSTLHADDPSSWFRQGEGRAEDLSFWDDDDDDDNAHHNATGERPEETARKSGRAVSAAVDNAVVPAATGHTTNSKTREEAIPHHSTTPPARYGPFDPRDL